MIVDQDQDHRRN